MPANEDITYRYVAQAALWLLALIITGMCGLALSILSDHASRLNANDKWMQQIQDQQNVYVYRFEQNEAAIRDMKAQQALMQHEVDLDREALHDLTDAFQRELSLRHK